MRRGPTRWAVCGILSWTSLVLVRTAVGQEPSRLEAEAGAAPATSRGEPADAGTPPVAISPTTPPAPSPSPAFQAADGGALDATPSPTPPGTPSSQAADGGAPVPSVPGNAKTALAAGPSVDMARFRYANTWDLNLEGGGGYVFGDVEKWSGFVRARPGVLIVRNDDFYQLGPTVEYLGMLKRPAFGAQVEYLHLQFGTWIQLGASIDTRGRPGGNAAVGLSVLGIEAQVREFDASPDPAFALIGKLRIPLGILVYGLSTKK